ncbi:MAG: phosphotransacetylase [Elusimicrobia bacterium]|nr:phosphotransacetylase [Elusimicrobiota bacterium]
MFDILENLKQKAGDFAARIIFPEGNDERVISAAKEIISQKIAAPVLVRKEEISGIERVWPENDKNLTEIAEKFYEKNRKKFDRATAFEIAKKPNYYAAMKLAGGEVDGFVGGASTSTAETVRALLRCVGLKDGVKTLSSFFMMLLKDKNFIFADCAIVPEPTAEQLAEISVQTAASCRIFLSEEPRVALLSFSTMGSAKSESAEIVRKAAEILANSEVDFDFFGEIQADAAIIPEIAEKKTNGKWKGLANVLIFPDLNSGNISYKLVERLAGAVAVGPILQGLKKPGNDLSRGCSKNDIIKVAAITALQAAMEAKNAQR